MLSSRDHISIAMLPCCAWCILGSLNAISRSIRIDIWW